MRETNTQVNSEDIGAAAEINKELKIEEIGLQYIPWFRTGKRALLLYGPFQADNERKVMFRAFTDAYDGVSSAMAKKNQDLANELNQTTTKEPPLFSAIGFSDEQGGHYFAMGTKVKEASLFSLGTKVKKSGYVRTDTTSDVYTETLGGATSALDQFGYPAKGIEYLNRNTGFSCGHHVFIQELGEYLKENKAELFTKYFEKSTRLPKSLTNHEESTSFFKSIINTKTKNPNTTIPDGFTQDGTKQYLFEVFHERLVNEWSERSEKIILEKQEEKYEKKFIESVEDALLYCKTLTIPEAKRTEENFTKKHKELEEKKTKREQYFDDILKENDPSSKGDAGEIPKQQNDTTLESDGNIPPPPPPALFRTNNKSIIEDAIPQSSVIFRTKEHNTNVLSPSHSVDNNIGKKDQSSSSFSFGLSSTPLNDPPTPPPVSPVVQKSSDEIDPNPFGYGSASTPLNDPPTPPPVSPVATSTPVPPPPKNMEGWDYLFSPLTEGNPRTSPYGRLGLDTSGNFAAFSDDSSDRENILSVDFDSGNPPRNDWPINSTSFDDNLLDTENVLSVNLDETQETPTYTINVWTPTQDGKGIIEPVCTADQDSLFSKNISVFKYNTKNFCIYLDSLEEETSFEELSGEEKFNLAMHGNRLAATYDAKKKEWVFLDNVFKQNEDLIAVANPSYDHESLSLTGDAIAMLNFATGKAETIAGRDEFALNNQPDARKEATKKARDTAATVIEGFTARLQQEREKNKEQGKRPTL